MVTINVVAGKVFDQSVDTFIMFVVQDELNSAALKAAEKELFPGLAAVMKKKEFTGRAQSKLELPLVNGKSVRSLLLVGLGEPHNKKKIPLEQYRRAVGVAIKTIAHDQETSCAFSLPAASLFDVSSDELMRQTVTIAEMAGYHYDELITSKHLKTADVQVFLCVDAKDKAAATKAAQEGHEIGRAVNTTRFWVDTPPSRMTPIDLAHEAKKIAKEEGLKFTSFSEAEINKMGMGGLASVSRGSELDCQLVIMEYHTKKKSAPTIAFVGKGITFDSGGLSLKPANAMETMKDDMSGAASVIATMRALAHLKPDVNVIGVAPLSENLPSGSASKPGDVVKFYNGKTAEIKNTDAEGRLILADALAYTVKHYKPDFIIDIATLTGACAHALGHFFTGMMSQHDDAVERVEAAARNTGDRVWRLPMDNDYKPAIKSTMADLCNIGSPSYKAGSITAAFFLQSFVGDTPWVHLDIAGTAFDVPDISYFRPGATGASVRLLIDLAMNWK